MYRRRAPHDEKRKAAPVAFMFWSYGCPTTEGYAIGGLFLNRSWKIDAVPRTVKRNAAMERELSITQCRAATGVAGHALLRWRGGHRFESTTTLLWRVGGAAGRLAVVWNAQVGKEKMKLAAITPIHLRRLEEAGCSGVNDYWRVKFFAAIVELARPSLLDVAIVLGPDLQSSLGDRLEVDQGPLIAADLNRYYQRADRGHYGRVLRRSIFEFSKCIYHDAALIPFVIGLACEP
jgi:hypothetical protein